MSRCTPNDIPFFRILLSFHSMLTINRYCNSLKILHLLRSHFSLLKNSLPIILHEVTTNEEFILTNKMIVAINPGIYIAFLQCDQMKYQPLFDLKLIPMELFPEKIFLPKSTPFVIYEINPFVKALSNTIEYIKDYEKTKTICRKYDETIPNSPLGSASQISTIKHRTKSNIAQSIISSDFPPTPQSTSSIIPIHISHDIDIRKYIVTDPTRIYQTFADKNSLPFTFRILSQTEQIIQQQNTDSVITFPASINIADNSQYQFNENELVLFKEHLTALTLDLPLKLELKNCLHQLANEKKLGKPEVCDILLKLNHQIIQNKDVLKMIQNLQEAASNNKREIAISNLMKILFRIDQLDKFNKLDKQKVKIFNERMNHLARMGILNQQSKMLKKLFQLNLFQSEPNRQAFAQFIDYDLQRIIPKQIPLNALGMKEIIHQLQINIDRLGVVTTLILIDNLQQIVHSGLLLTLNKTPQLKRYLMQFVEHIQTGRFIGIHLQRVSEQMNNSVQLNTVKKGLLTNLLNSLLQTKLLSKNSYDQLISVLMNLASKGQLNTYANVIEEDMKIKQQNLSISEIDNNNLQSLLLFLHEQSSAASPSGHLPYHYICDFIQYLRHFAQLGILYEPQISYILTDLHKAKDQNNITIERLKTIFEQIKTINYVYAYHHLNLIEFNTFLNDMVLDGELSGGQAWYVLDRLVDLCQKQPITNYDIKALLTNVRLEHNRQQSVYPKLVDFLQTLAKSHSNSLAELHSLERDLQKILLPSNNNIKRIPDEARRRLNEMILLCKKFSNDPALVEQLFGQTMNYKFYNKMKEMLKTKNLFGTKQSLTAIVQIHKHFLQISRLNSQNFATDLQLDLILENIRVKCPKQQKDIEETLKHMAELGHLQDKPFVDYLSNELSSWNPEKCLEIRTKLQAWPFSLDLNHTDVREVIEHLTQLESKDKIDTGTLIEIQNRLNQLARFGKCSSPQIKLLIDGILKSQGKTYLSDKDGFQLIQFFRSILNDITYAIEFEFYIQQLASEHQISDNLNYRFRHFLYRILQNQLSIDELSRHRLQLQQFHRIKQMDIEQVKRFVDLLPHEFNNLFSLTLTDKLLERVKWDGKILDESIRDTLLKFERCGVLSTDTFEEIFNNLYRTADISFLSLDHTNNNRLFFDLFDKINDLVNDGTVELQQSIQVKEQLYFLEDIIDSTNISRIITFQSRLFNSSNQKEFQTISVELHSYIHQEQFRLSKAQDLISTWHLNAEKGNPNEKQIVKLLNDLANLNRLYSSSTIPLFNRNIEAKQVNQTVYRHLIKDLQNLKDKAIIDQQAIECLRSIEARINKYDYKKRFHELLIKNLENRLKQTFSTLSHSIEQHIRLDICKKLNELVEIYIKSNTEEYSSEQFINTFDLSITQIKQGQLRPSKTRHHYATSDATVPQMSPSLKSLPSID